MIGNLKELYFIMHRLGSTVLIDESAIFYKQILYY